MRRATLIERLRGKPRIIEWHYWIEVDDRLWRCIFCDRVRPWRRILLGNSVAIWPPDPEDGGGCPMRTSAVAPCAPPTGTGDEVTS